MGFEIEKYKKIANGWYQEFMKEADTLTKYFAFGAPKNKDKAMKRITKNTDLFKEIYLVFFIIIYTVFVFVCPSILISGICALLVAVIYSLCDDFGVEAIAKLPPMYIQIAMAVVLVIVSLIAGDITYVLSAMFISLIVIGTHAALASKSAKIKGDIKKGVEGMKKDIKKELD
ncbi:hypothetical protein EIN_309320 [Entamoeba invadens IP1]|uniref:PRA1 family protein n=1 Tax=Entamoeba invadens IP1 TaxID=370355 RepID=A0A0A1TWA1_ENTIV|nr:hypothetical protein EIN_309320 [Entamoeba invadens IP1]ELP84949.1 hypothetical protein EIN_309320 [Entamoeba invadens IP1]|eukprot:XP_004184295.1 hypothetical protein EIN_309320 [Entamoeba invadens IP1]